LTFRNRQTLKFYEIHWQTALATQSIQPFLKWPGGKRWLANDIVAIIRPKLKGCYFEPFLGGGAVFFYLNPAKAVLSDINEELINAYQQVRDHPNAIIDHVKREKVTKKNYYRIRRLRPRSPLNRSARFLFLNRTAFGGIYRMNGRGEFNVPYGGGERTPEALWGNSLVTNASKALKGIRLLTADFEEVMGMASTGDVIYCDPTYTVAHENNGFLRYNEKNFSWNDQKRLHKAARQALARGATVIVSNAAHASLRDLYWPYKPIVRSRQSLVSPKPALRKSINEWLFVLAG
jgi:DNA adenine methylase